MYKTAGTHLSHFPRTEIQGCGAQSEYLGGGWLRAGEEVLRGHGSHAPQESRGCQGTLGSMTCGGFRSTPTTPECPSVL